MKCLLLVDIQNDYFSDGAFPLPGMEQAARNAAALLAWARKQGIRVIHVRHEESDPAAGFLVQETKGAELHQSVLPKSGEPIITKHFPNSFRETALRDYLEGINELIICGAMSNMCIDATARAAFDLNYKVTVIEDACAASNLEFQGESIEAKAVHGSFMAALASAYGEVLNTKSLVS